MHQITINSGRDALLIAIPFLILMLLGLFRIDEVIAAPKRKKSERSRLGLCGTDKAGQAILRDPDGKRWYPSHK